MRPKVKRLPVFQSTSCSGISVRILAMKARPVQCIGITTSGVRAFSSPIGAGPKGDLAGQFEIHEIGSLSAYFATRGFRSAIQDFTWS
jgi:hypothetical protein